MNSIITAYCACTLCCGPGAKGINALGKRPQQGISIAAPRSIPLGTHIKVTVPGAFTNKVFIVDDRTAKRFDGRFDLFFASHKEALKFGKREGIVTK